MADGDREDLETRVLVLAPTARDAAATRDFLAAAGVASVACPTIADICREATRGAGAALVTAEAVLADRERQLAAVLRAQPPWSDLPLVVLTPPRADSSRLLLALEEVGPMTLMKRPVQVSTLVSTVRAVLRDRRRQYAVREHLVERARSEAALRESKERLRLALSAARMGTWTWDVVADAHHRDANLNALLGLPAEETVQPLAEFLTHIHPDDREAVQAAFDQSVRRGRPLNTEFRAVWPDGTVRWLRDQGDVFGIAGQARMTGACVDVTDLKEAEAAVRRSEERLRLTLESATDHAIFTLDPDRVVTSWSPGAVVVFGYAADEIVGRSGDVVFTPEDREAGVPEKETDTARQAGRAADERWHMRKDGSRFFASGVLTPLGADARGFVRVARDLTERKRMEDGLRHANDELEGRVRARTAELATALDSLEAEMSRRRDLAKKLSTAQEDERLRMSRDLHDSVGQLLAGLSLTFKSIEGSGDLPSPIASRLAEAQQVLNDLGREVHGLAVRLRPTSLDDIGLEPALAQLVAEWSARSGVKADYHSARLGPGRLPTEVETTVYRVVQEALTNVAKHAKATAVSVVVTQADGFVSVAVEDNGAGFEPDAAPKGRLGLLGMRERVELVGGTIEIESSPGAGTTVVVQIPTNGGVP